MRQWAWLGVILTTAAVIALLVLVGCTGGSTMPPANATRVVERR